MGPSSIVSIEQKGAPLPEVTKINAYLQRDGTTLKLNWDKPKYDKVVNWTYGVYYGITYDALFESKLHYRHF